LSTNDLSPEDDDDDIDEYIPEPTPEQVALERKMSLYHQRINTRLREPTLDVVQHYISLRNRARSLLRMHAIPGCPPSVTERGFELLAGMLDKIDPLWRTDGLEPAEHARLQELHEAQDAATFSAYDAAMRAKEGRA